MIASKEVQRGKVVRKLAKTPKRRQTTRITNTSDEKSHVNPLMYTRAKKTERQSKLFIVTAPYICQKKKRKYLDASFVMAKINK